jgi:hypothetical protein
MKRVFFALVFTFALGLGSAFAQEPVPSPTPTTTRLAWNHDGANLAGFRFYIDSGAAQDVGIPSQTPAGLYNIAFPALTPGIHVLEVSAYNQFFESGRASLSVRVVIVPIDPTNLQIIIVRDMPLLMNELHLEAE